MKREKRKVISLKYEVDGRRLPVRSLAKAGWTADGRTLIVAFRGSRPGGILLQDTFS